MRPLFATIVAGCATIAVGGCRAPTQITLEVRTDIPCSEQQGTRIFVGPVVEASAGEAAVVTDRCAGGRIGSLVVVPSGGRSDELGIRVVLGRGRSPKSCDEAWGPGCILARRALHFVPHESLVLPIDLRQTCDGVQCPSDQTCVDGACRFARVDDPGRCTDVDACDEKTLTLAGDAGVDAEGDVLVDAPGDALDARPDGGDAADAPVTTSAPACGDMSKLMAGSPWPMELGCPFHRGRSPVKGTTTTPRLAWPAVVFDGDVRRDVLMTASGKLIVVVDPSGTGPALIAAVNASDGKTAWQHALEDNATGAPLLHANGNVYVTQSSLSNHLYAYEADTGVAAAGFPKTNEGSRSGLNLTRSGDLLGKNTVGEAVRWDVATGAVVWAKLVGSNDFGSPVVTSTGTIYYGVADGSIFTVDEALGTPTLFAKTSGVSDILHIRPDGELVSSSASGDVSFVSPTGGDDGFVNLGSAGIAGVTVGDDDTSYAVVENGVVWIVDKAKTKRLLTPGGLSCSMVTIDAAGNLFGACDGKLYAKRSDGSDLWSVTFGDVTESLEGQPILGPDGAVYLGTAKGRLLAYVP